MLESSKLGFWYLNTTWTRSPSCTRSPIGTGIHLGMIQAFLVIVDIQLHVGILV